MSLSLPTKSRKTSPPRSASNCVKAGIDHQFLTINSGNTLNADSTELAMPLVADNKFQLNTTSISGVKVDMNFGEGKAPLAAATERYLPASAMYTNRWCSNSITTIW